MIELVQRLIDRLAKPKVREAELEHRQGAGIYYVESTGRHSRMIGPFKWPYLIVKENSVVERAKRIARIRRQRINEEKWQEAYRLYLLGEDLRRER